MVCLPRRSEGFPGLLPLSGKASVGLMEWRLSEDLSETCKLGHSTSQIKGRVRRGRIKDPART